MQPTKVAILIGVIVIQLILLISAWVQIGQRNRLIEALERESFEK